MSMDTERIAAALPGYEIRGEIGRGAWGVVLAAEHRQLGRGVAVKQLPSAFASNPAIQRRFTAEARVLASLDHPHIVPIFDYVEQDGLWLLVMELLPGGTVRDRFGSDGIGAEAACGIALATCAALHYAHAKSILHRDIKPENLMFNATGTLKVTDFGIAKVLGGAETLVTMTGEVLGTPAFMAPEQVSGGALTPATDVYAVATMLYELLSGVLPFSEEGGLISALFRHVYEQPVPLLDVAPRVSGPLAEVIMQGLATEPEERYPSADDFGVALVEAANDSWGPQWLSSTDLDVVTSKRVAQRISGAAAGIPTRPADSSPKVVGRPSGTAPRPSLADREVAPRPLAEPVGPGDVMGLAELLQRGFGSRPASAAGGTGGAAVAGPPQVAPPFEGRPPETAPPPPLPSWAGTGPEPAPASGRKRGRRLLWVVGPSVLLLVAAGLLISRHNGAPPAKAAVAGPPGVLTSSTTGPAPATAKPVYADDFTNGASGWLPDANQPGAGTAEYRSDGYYVTASKPLAVLNTFSVGSPYAPRLSSLHVAVDATFVNAAPSDGAGVRCDQGSRNGLRYTFQIFGDGTWVIFQLGALPNGALKMGSSPAIRTGTGTNTIAGQCTEVSNTATVLAMSVNGVELGSFTYVHPAGALTWHAALTIYRAASSPGTVVRFNNFRTVVPAS